MGKQNTPLILGFVNNAARNTFNVSQKQVQNKNAQQKAVKQQKPQQQGWTVVNKKTNTKGTQSFQSWADVASRNTKSELQKSSWANVVKQQSKTQQRSKNLQQQAKPVQKQQQKQQQKKNTKTQPTQSWGWYPASKQEAELKKLNQRSGKTTKQTNRKVQSKQLSKQQKMKNATMMQMKTKREAQARKREQEMKKNFKLLKNINHLYDAYNLRLPSESSRGAWISANKVGGDKVLSVATLFAIRNAPVTRNKKPFVQRNGQIIFNNKCIRRAVEGKYTGHKKFRGNRVLTYIPEKWLTQENGYAKGANYEKFANINGPKRNERCYSFKGVY
jgi:hypothetical protein